MINQPFLIIIFLLSLEIIILHLSTHPRTKKYFEILPSVFWIYFLPMLASTFGILDSKSPVYQEITKYLLPASLFLLLICVDVKAILRLGKTALMTFFIGAVGIMAGACLSFFIFKRWVGADFALGFGALSASWTGGSANMIAVKEAMSVPDNVFLPMVIVDTIVPYLWMGILVAVVGIQKNYDRWNRSDRTIIDDLSRKISHAKQLQKKPLKFSTTIMILLLALAGSLVSQMIAKQLPSIHGLFSTYAWTIIVMTFLGLFLSLTPLKKMENYGSSRIGYFLLYFVLTTIGAKATIANVGSVLILILSGFVIVIVHISFLFAFARLRRIPLFLVVAASQANIGGMASAPVVAEIYQPGLASVGLLLAILGNIVGTYLGILVAYSCQYLSLF